MTHRTDQHLEHAEHTQHHAHDPFDRQVAMTMAMVAAVLACVSMLSHRAHNDTLKMHILANDDITEESNRWGYFQAKKNRAYMYAADARLLEIAAKDSSRPDAAKEAEKQIAKWKGTAEKYEKDCKDIEEGARKLGEKAKEEDEAAEIIHHRADRLDFGGLGIELALVLCSIAVLTKQRGFWYCGIGVGVLGAIVAFSSFLMPVPTAVRADEVKGKIKNISAGTREFTLTDNEGKNYELIFNEDGKVKLGDKDGKFSDLKEGDEVTVTYEKKDGKLMASEVKCKRE